MTDGTKTEHCGIHSRYSPGCDACIALHPDKNKLITDLCDDIRSHVITNIITCGNSDADFDKYWRRSESAEDMRKIVKQIPREGNVRAPRQAQRAIETIAWRAWFSATKKIRKDFNIVWDKNKWVIKQ